MAAGPRRRRCAAGVFQSEAGAGSDNPLVFPQGDEVVSGGNFHAEPVALAADALAVAIAEIGALAERRIALLIDPTLSGLPPFLGHPGGGKPGLPAPQGPPPGPPARKKN